jgi:hypothetical protein
MVANHGECTLALLRYSLGGNRPSQTDPLAMSLDWLHSTRLEFFLIKSGVSSFDSMSAETLTSKSPTYTTHH